MRKTLIAPACFALACLALPVTSLAEDTQTKDPSIFTDLDVFQLEYASDTQISPDGSLIAYVRRSNNIMTDRTRSNIWTVATDDGDHRPLLSGKSGYSSPRWSPSGDRIAYVTGAEGGTPQLYVRWMDSGQTALLTNLTHAPQSIAWSPDGTQIAFAMFVDGKPASLASAPAKPEGAEWAPAFKVFEDVLYRIDGAGYAKPGHPQIFVVPADGGTPRQMTDGEFNHGGPLSWSPDGEVIYFSANRNDDWERDLVEGDIWRVDLNDKKLTQLTTRDGPDNSPLVSPDGARIAYLGFDDKMMGYQTPRIYVMDIDGSNRTLLTGEFDRQIGAIAWAGNDELIAQYDDRGRSYLGRVTLDGEVTPLVRDVGGTSLGRPYTSGGFSVNAKGDIAYTSGRASRPADVAMKLSGGSSTRLTHLNDDLFADKTLGAVERMTWKSSADGRDIEGWLVTPPNFDRTKKYPLILEIHGGPFAAYGPNFSAEIQLYASAGYVVLYTNPRGSTSYGDTFANLIHHAYPGEDYDDLMSGVDAAIARGFIDEDNLFVTGGSGGGVLTAWIVGKTDRFKASVVAKPVINWTSFSLTADFYTLFYKYWFANPPWEDPDAYWARSPLSLVGNVTTPTMVMTGEADYRTPSAEAEQFYQALQLREVDTALVRVPESPHHIAGRPSNLIAKAANIIAWFERYRTDKETEE
ncbi:MAG: S9 family peptidase [Alphaproteobacteria bacterium]|nr:S9 family peptidase [Alphaproteobacteria bacterium]